MKNGTSFSLNFAKVIEQAEQELRCEHRESCGDCGSCSTKNAHHFVPPIAKVEQTRVFAAAVSTD